MIRRFAPVYQAALHSLCLSLLNSLKGVDEIRIQMQLCYYCYIMSFGNCWKRQTPKYHFHAIWKWPTTFCHELCVAYRSTAAHCRGVLLKDIMFIFRCLFYLMVSNNWDSSAIKTNTHISYLLLRRLNDGLLLLQSSLLESNLVLDLGDGRLHRRRW